MSLMTDAGLFAVDLFAGGGGASQGIKMATGRAPIVAINHNELAILMHSANHPDTIHYREDVFKVSPKKAVHGRPVDVLWASPDCTHFSRSRGGKPKSKKIRGLAWVVVKWAKQVSPRLICVENVEEFQTWGPLYPTDHPDPALRDTPIKERAGETFREWVRQLEDLGYVVEWRALVAADYGAPTSRKRLFIIARRDGLPVRWPEKTHGPGRARPYRTAAECIDWGLPCPSIFDRKKPLADATLRRIAEGIRRYVLGAKRPFLVNLTHGGRVEDTAAPMKTVTGAHRGEKAVVIPSIVQTSHQSNDAGKVREANAPLSTIVTKAEHLVVAAFLARHNGTTPGKYNGGSDLRAPLPTVVGRVNQGVTAVSLVHHRGRSTGQRVAEPLTTITDRNHHSVAAVSLIHHRGESVGRGVEEPTPTVTAGGQGHLGLSAVFLDKMYGSARAGQGVDEPLPTVTAQGGHEALVAAFLAKYYKSGGQWQGVDVPLDTVVSKARFGLVTVTLDGEEYAITDIGMRMLQPRELARAQGFEDDYVLVGTKEQQVSKIGNSVVPQVAAAVVSANMW